MIEADLAEFIDENETVGELRRAQQAIEQRRLAGAEEAGDDRQGKGAVVGRLTHIAQRKCVH